MYIMEPYDDALRQILREGTWKPNRTGIDAIGINGMQRHYDIRTCYPLLTGRKVWPRSVLGELLWFLSGSTNNHDLLRLGAKFWTDWVDIEFEKKWGYSSGEFGPIYGYQLRNQGGTYPLHNGTDQLAYMEREIKNNPYSRRILFSLWNVGDLDKMRLPPCHYTYQILLDGKDRLSGIMTQRSCDMVAGVPANIQFYSTLTLMFAQVGDFEPYEFVHNTNDSHIYKDQVEAVEEYLSRSKPDSPTLYMTPTVDSIREFQMEDFVIHGYHPLDPIKIPVAV